MNLANTFKFVPGQTSPEDALSSADYPASGSYIDVTGYQWANVVIHLGALADAITFEIKEAEATNGTADSIDTTYCKHTCAANDDDEMITFAIETAKLSADHHFLTCTVAEVSGSNYADIMFVLGPARHQPVTQSDSLPSASQHEHAG